ncbi:GNAT family N-acetyltransferase [Solicola sp. PLA-1-18]|uniref:GNAT family N-acetyltransferase n=1 Tax=Solicola sp. PLA-1-18 TaxID=3380532 RepID=UPI003B7B7E89
MRIEVRAYDHPQVVALVERVQAEYTVLYGSPDEGPADGAQFVPPAGLFGVGLADGVPVAMGGWRQLDDERAEIKRMYVPDEHRGRGHARQMLHWLERTAAEAGARRLVLETGLMQPAAVAMYRSGGYTDVEAFGHYADSPLSVYLGRDLAVSATRPCAPRR